MKLYIPIEERIIRLRENTIKHIWKKVYSDGDITLEDFKNLSQKNCHYCDSVPSNKTRLHTSKTYDISEYFIYNGLDRVDNSILHMLSNVVPCCRWCNQMKLNY